MANIGCSTRLSRSPNSGATVLGPVDAGSSDHAELAVLGEEVNAPGDAELELYPLPGLLSAGVPGRQRRDHADEQRRGDTGSPAKGLCHGAPLYPF